jgi:putative N6-adenine-specific DNA methylase
MTSYEYQQRGRFFAQTPEEIKELAAEELLELGARDIKAGFRGLFFETDRAGLYRINYSSRLISRVLAPLLRFRCHNPDYLYKKAKGIPWEDFLAPDRTFAVFAHVSQSKIRHSQYAGLRVKDGIADHFLEKFGQRPSIHRTDPDGWINLHVENNQAAISWDTSGGSLHRRGYRDEGMEAPMQEIVAAAILRLSQWDGSRRLRDPMCGSGTLLTEALMSCGRIPSGVLRERFGFEFMPDFDEALWDEVKEEAMNGIRHVPEELIVGSDISPEAVAAARKNASRLPQGDKIQFIEMDFREIEEWRDKVIITNPPYGIRIGRGEDVGRLYKEFGDFLKRKCQGSQAYIYFGNREMIRHIGLRPSWKKPLNNGGLDGRLVKFEMY